MSEGNKPNKALHRTAISLRFIAAGELDRYALSTQRRESLMFKKVAVSIFTLSILAGCASVPMETTEKSNLAKQFNPPAGDKSGVYVFRSGSFGGALKKDVWLDGKCIGETAPDVFFYEEVKGDAEHKFSTESEFSPNDLAVNMAAGKNYFVRQYIKMGIFVGGAGLEIVGEEEGKKEVSGLDMAIKGTCSK